MNDVEIEVQADVGLITLNRPKSLNALTLSMVRNLTTTLLAWMVMRRCDRLRYVETGWSSWCFLYGGRYPLLSSSALAGDLQLEDFFTEEYSLNHLIHIYRKPLIAFMDASSKVP